MYTGGMKTEISIECVGYSIKADWYEGDGSKIVSFILIGYNSNKERYEDYASTFVSKTGNSALVLDYSGHGNSPFELDDLTPAQNFLEVVAVFDWLVANYPGYEIDINGCSYGAFLAALLTQYRDFHKLVLRVPAMYTPEDYYTPWKFTSSDERKKYRLNPENFTDHPILTNQRLFTGDTLVVTHEFDDICPKATTDAFVNSFSAESWEAPGFEHSFGRSDVSDEQIEEYQTKIAEWLVR